MMLSVFLIASSLRRDDQGVVGRGGHLPEIGRAAAAHAGDRIDGAALVDTEAAIHPVDPAAVPGRLLHHGLYPFARQRMVLLHDVVAMHGVGVLLLAGERQADRALIGEYVDVVAAPGRDIDE